MNSRKVAAMAKNKLHYDITAKDRSKQAMRSVQGGLRATNKAANLLKTAIGGIAVGLAVRSLARFTNDAIKAADAIAKTADKVGVGVVALQQLRFAADLAGVGQEKLDSSLERFTKRIGEASQGTGEAKKALELLGVSFANADGKIRPTEAVLSAVADAMASVESPAQRAALAAQLFGREGVGLVNLLKGGSATLREFGAQAEAAGAVLSEDLARAAEVLNDKLTVSNRALDKAKIKIGLAFAQSGVIDLFTRAVQKLARVMSDQRFIRKFKDGIKTVERALKFVGRYLEEISKGFLIVFGYFVIKRISLVAIAIAKFAKVIIASGIAMTVLRAISSKVGLGLIALGGAFSIAFGASQTFREGVHEATQDLDNFLGVSEMVTGANAALDRVLGVTKESFDDLGREAENTGEAFLFAENNATKAKGAVEALGQSALTAFGSGAAAGVKEYFDGIRDHSANAKTFVTSAFGALERTLSDFFLTGELSFKTFADTVKRGLADIAAKGVISFASGVAETVLGGVGKKIGTTVTNFLNFASGGYVSGPGGDRSDNIPAMLSPGEYVVNAASVRKYGTGFFGALNANNRGAVDTDSGLPGFGFGSFISKAFKSVTKIIKKVVGFVTSSIKGTIEGLMSGDPIAIASIVSSFILPGVMSAVTGAVSAASAATAFGGVMSAQGLSVAASLAGQAAGGISAVATGITNGISNSFAKGILGGQFSASAVAQSLVGGQVSKLATSAVSSALGGGGFNREAAAQGLFDTRGEDFSRAITAALGRVVTEAGPFLDRRARGGPVSSGRPYLVGERGPEVFTPGRAGSVSPSINASQIVDAVHEVRDEMSALRRQFARALSGASLAGARA
jgi:hypothetical protein